MLIMPAPNLTPCLWYDDQAEAAANFYLDIFPNSKITTISRYQQDMNGKPAGSVLAVTFELDGRPFMALNGGPMFQFTEAISFQVMCESQNEVDYYWGKLSAGGDPEAQNCGWLKDRYGVSWQIVPTVLVGLLTDPDPEKGKRVMQAMLQMVKLDIAVLQRAHAG